MSRLYDRDRDLPRLLPLTAEQLADPTIEGQRRLIALLTTACRLERARGLAGDWTYDLARHRALIGALAVEEARLAQREALRAALIASIEMEMADA
ncbi:MAG TPA: DUF6477 family protein [Xanthobacteraceae bacterium]|nr:DUF6477 family protein [Xanthobacteraceae bacterium]